MFLSRSFPFSSSYRLHAGIASLNGGILVFILLFLQPFNMSSFQHDFKNLLLFGYGICAFLGYIIVQYFTNLYFKRNKIWNWGNEIIFLVVSNIIGISIGYYYHIKLVNPMDFSISSLLFFMFYICLPTLPLIAGFTAVIRYLAIKESSVVNTTYPTSEKKEYLDILSNNKKENFVIAKNKLIYVRALDNYVQFYILNEKDTLQKKIIRTTLNKVEKSTDYLLKTHRSYLVNADFIKKISGNSQKASITLTYVEETIPLSKSYYKKVKKSLSFYPKK